MSCLRTRQVSWDVSAVASFLCDKDTVLGDIVKETLCLCLSVTVNILTTLFYCKQHEVKKTHINGDGEFTGNLIMIMIVIFWDVMLVEVYRLQENMMCCMIMIYLR